VEFRAPIQATRPAEERQYLRHESAPPLVYTVVDEAGAVRYGGRLAAEVALPVVVSGVPARLRLRAGPNDVPVRATVYDPTADSLLLGLRFAVPPGAPLAGAGAERRLAAENGTTEAVLQLDVPAGVPPGTYPLVALAGIKPVTAFDAAHARPVEAVVLPEIRVAEGLRVGFVRSYDAATEDALRAMGAEVVALDSAALAEGRFDGLHTVVLDIRAYLARPDLRAHNGRLLDWVRRGGHLVVGYQKTFEWNPGAADPTQPEESGAVNPDFAPYPLVLGRGRVVREDAPVEVLDPAHPFFTAPNAVGPGDWAGWVQERGLYFPETYDPRYRELLATSDPGEEPLRGGLLLAEVGEGTYLYSPLVWYRQLEALNPGAWRLFANLVSLPLTDSRAAPGSR